MLLSTIALFLASLAPLAFGAGWVYGAGALVGGLHFVRKSWQLARKPERATAMGCFCLSVQLSLLLVAASIDALMR